MNNENIENKIIENNNNNEIQNLIKEILKLKSFYPKQINQTIFEEIFKLSIKFKYPNINNNEIKINLSKYINNNNNEYIKIDCCINNHECFINEKQNNINCSICNYPRFTKCNRGNCINKEYNECNHSFKLRTSN